MVNGRCVLSGGGNSNKGGGGGLNAGITDPTVEYDRKSPNGIKDDGGIADREYYHWYKNGDKAVLDGPFYRN